ncbi:MAG: hypothetical protein HY673_20980 [Chloroflexi bacterium]|nr:hypothetical protein [Chloroflexota bacterium]
MAKKEFLPRHLWGLCRVSKIVATVAFISFVAAACAPTISSPPMSVPSGSSAEQRPTRSAWEEDWGNTLKKAQKEGSVVVYGAGGASILKSAATDLIKEKFGFNLETVTGQVGALNVKIRRERQAGLFLADLYMSGLKDIRELKQDNALQPMKPEFVHPEVMDPKGWFGGQLPPMDKEGITVTWAQFVESFIAINTDLVNPQDIRTLRDLMGPKWKGKMIINDPSIGSGAGFTGFSTLIFHKIVDLDFFRELMTKQDLVVTRDLNLQVQGLAKGKYLIALGPAATRMEALIQTGAPVAYLISDNGVYLTAGGSSIAMFDKAPHPNAARILLNWSLTREGQLLLQNASGLQSLREDIPTDTLNPFRVRLRDRKYIRNPTDGEEFLVNDYPRYTQWAREIFAR